MSATPSLTFPLTKGEERGGGIKDGLLDGA